VKKARGLFYYYIRLYYAKRKKKKSWDSSKAFIAKTPKNEQNKEHAATAVVDRVVTAEEESKTQDIERHRCSPH